MENKKKNYGIFKCPDCKQDLSYLFSNETIWKEAQKEIKDKVKEIIFNDWHEDEKIASLQEFLEDY